MKALIFNEIEKLVKSKLLYVAIFFVALFSAFAVNQQGNLLRDFADRDPRTIGKQIQVVEEKLKDPNLTDDQKKIYQKMIENYKIAQEANQKKKDAFQTESQRVDILEAERLVAEYLEKNGITQEDLYARNNFTILFRVLASNESIVIFLIVALLGGYIVSSEYQPATIKVLVTRSIPRWKILASKYATMLLSAAMIASVAVAVISVWSGLQYGWGASDYPVSIGAQFTFDGNPTAIFREGSTQITHRWVFATAAFVHTVFVCIVTATLAFAISSVCPWKVLALVLSFMGVIGFFLLSIVSDTRSIEGILNFMSYFTLAPIWSGALLSKLVNGNITVGFAEGILALWMLIPLTVSFCVFTRRDVME